MLGSKASLANQSPRLTGDKYSLNRRDRPLTSYVQLRTMIARRCSCLRSRRVRFLETMLQVQPFLQLQDLGHVISFYWLVLEVIEGEGTFTCCKVSTGIGRDRENNSSSCSACCTPEAYECEASLMEHESSKQRHNSVCRVLSAYLRLPLSP